MTQEDQVNIRDSIATRLLRIVFCFYLIIAIGVTLGHMAMEYRYQKNSISRDLEDIQKTFENGLAIDMWQLNQQSLRSTVEGMLEVPVITGVSIMNADGNDVAVGGIIVQDGAVGNVGLHVNLLGLSEEESAVHEDEPYKLDVFTHRFSVVYLYGGEMRTLGEATIYSSTSVVFRRVKLGFLLLVVNAVLKTTALWFIFLWVSNLLLRRPLASLASAAKNVSLENLDSFNVDVKTSGRNELKVLEESFNSMIGNLNTSMARRKNVEEALGESEERYRTLFERSNDAIFLVDTTTGRYLAANKAAERLTGRSLSELTELTTRDVTPDGARDPLKTASSVDSASDLGEVKYVRPDGSVRIALLQSVPLNDRTVFGLARDITERKELEANYQQAQKIEAVGRLAGGVAHDLNNLLSPILGYADILEDRLAPGDERREYANQIACAGERARDLVGQLLAFGRKQTLEYRPLDINATIKDIEKLLRRTLREDIDFRIIVAPLIKSVRADAGQIEQVILNLCVNAQDAMIEGGELTLQTSEVELDEDYAADRPDCEAGQYVMLAVTDTGCGMDEKTCEHIFEPFFSTKGELGTGLGLATVYGIVKQHGGNIWVYSEPGQGTTFKVYLPVSDEAPVARKSEEKSLEELKGSETVLLVEDSQPVRDLGEMLLTEQGYRVLVAKNGADALAILEADNGPLDLLLTDVVMPEMNGKDLARRALDVHPEIRVLYMSGYTDEVIARRGVLEEGVQFIQKPFTAQGLASKVREVLEA